MKSKTLGRLLSLFISATLLTAAVGCGATPQGDPSTGEASTEASGEEKDGNESSTEGASASDASEGSEVTGENMLENGDFSSGTDLWDTFCFDGEAEISVNSDGELDVDIKNIGTVVYGVQLYHDGFSMDEGCVYKISFDAYSDADKLLEMRFQLNGGDYHEYFLENVPVGKDKQHYEYTFTMKDTSDPAPRFCINMGVAEKFDNPKGEHHVYFDNFVLTLEDDSQRVASAAGAAMPDIAVNQIGYMPGEYKSATLRAGALSQTAKLINEDTGEAVLEEEIGEGTFDADTDENEADFDFTSITEEGTYHVEAGDQVSPSFKIAKDVYEDAFKAAVKMLYYQRCGSELTEDLAGDFAHPVCHADEAVLYEDKSKSLDVSGGWHDAGDYGRYSVAGAKAAADLLLAYENYPEVFGDDFGIPESGNKIPDVLDEVRYELDWLLKMQRDDGGVYHKVTCSGFPGEIMPQDETGQLIIMPVTTTSTGDFAGVMAIASRVFEKSDKAYSKKCLEAAKKAADYLESTPSDTVGYKNPGDISTGEYEDTNDLDERFWAYAELFKTTGDKAYEELLKNELPDNGYSLGWQGVAGYGAYAYLTAKKADADTLAKVKEEAEKTAEDIVTNADTYAYGSSIVGDYPWGSNLTIANNGEYLLMMEKAIDDDNKETIDKQLSYIFGNNPTGYSFFTGFGTTYTDHPHHRPSQAKGKTVPGMVAGGTNNGLNDPYAANVLKDAPRAKCYVDNSQSYSTNEVAIYWNSPLIYLLAGELAETK